MARWSVAIMGHDKNNPDGRDEFRAQFGDIIAFKPEGHQWSEKERKLFLIVQVDGPTASQMAALAEPYYDAQKAGIQRKRRFALPEATMKNLGVDISKAKDTGVVYQPLESTYVWKEDFFDKMTSRNVAGTDGLNLIKDRA